MLLLNQPNYLNRTLEITSSLPQFSCLGVNDYIFANQVNSEHGETWFWWSKHGGTWWWWSEHSSGGSSMVEHGGGYVTSLYTTMYIGKLG